MVTTHDAPVTGSAHDSGWVPWIVAPAAGFLVDEPSGLVRVEQITDREFNVLNRFAYADRVVIDGLVDSLVGSGLAHDAAVAAVDAARTYTPRRDDPTDLASIPQFLRWFANPYGRYTLAALIHDELITDAPNTGALGSDTLSDHFFREMMRTSGVPWLKRWLMWSAVALRTRWAAGGFRRLSVIVWLVLSVFGITCAVGGLGTWIWAWMWPVPAWWSLLVAVVLMFVAAPLWGKQWGASLVAAIAAIWLVPAGIAAGLGYLAYVAMERAARAVGLR